MPGVKLEADLLDVALELHEVEDLGRHRGVPQILDVPTGVLEALLEELQRQLGPVVIS